MSTYGCTHFSRIDIVTETVVNRKELPEILLRKFRTENVRVKETDGVLYIMPVKDDTDPISKLLGMFAGNPDLTVDRFIEEKQTEKELEF